MDSKQFLEQAIKLTKSIRSLREEAKTYRELAEGAGAIRYDRDGSQTQRSQNAPFEMPLVTAADLESEVEKDIQERWEALREIRLVISQVEDQDVQDILRRRFLALKTPKEIQTNLKISSSTYDRRLKDGYHEVSLLTGMDEPPKVRMPGRDRHHIAREMMKEVYGDDGE